MSIGTVELSEGTFTTAVTISLNRGGQTLCGMSRLGTIISPNAQTFAAITVPALGSDASAITAWTLRDFYINYGGTPASNAAAIGVKLVRSGGNYPFHFGLHNLRIQSAYDGFSIDTDPATGNGLTFMGEFSRIHMVTPGRYGFYIPGISTTISFTNTYVQGNGSTGGSTGFYIFGSDSLSFASCAIDSMPAGTLGKLYLGTCRTTINGLYFESNILGNSESLLFVSAGQALISGAKWYGNTFSPAAGQASFGLRITDNAKVTVAGLLSDDNISDDAGDTYQIAVDNGSEVVLQSYSTESCTGGTGGNYGIRPLTGSLAHPIVNYTDFSEVSAPTTPIANTARLYARDNGAGKTQIVVLFPSGAAQVMATEP